MLKGLNPLLGPDLLATLRAMGHGDEIAIVDANYPAAANARRLVRCDGHDLADILSAVLSVLPLDDFVSAAAFTMTPVDPAQERPEAFAIIERALVENGEALVTEPLERMAFYARSQACFAIVASGERRLYGNVILKKGVVRPAPAKSDA